MALRQALVMTKNRLTTGAGEDRRWLAGKVVQDLQMTNLGTTAKHAKLSREAEGRESTATAPKTGQI